MKRNGLILRSTFYVKNVVGKILKPMQFWLNLPFLIMKRQKVDIVYPSNNLQGIHNLIESKKYR